MRRTVLSDPKAVAHVFAPEQEGFGRQARQSQAQYAHRAALVRGRRTGGGDPDRGLRARPSISGALVPRPGRRLHGAQPGAAMALSGQHPIERAGRGDPARLRHPPARGAPVPHRGRRQSVRHFVPGAGDDRRNFAHAAPGAFAAGACARMRDRSPSGELAASLDRWGEPGPSAVICCGALGGARGQRGLRGALRLSRRRGGAPDGERARRRPNWFSPGPSIFPRSMGSPPRRRTNWGPRWRPSRSSCAKWRPSSPPIESFAEDLRLLEQSVDQSRTILGKLSSPRPVSGQQQMDISSPANWSEIAAASHRLLGVTITVEGEGPEPPPPCDRNAGVLYGLGNLIENAVSFAEKAVVIRASWTKSTVRIVIADDGPGFPPEYPGAGRASPISPNATGRAQRGGGRRPRPRPLHRHVPA